MNQARKDKGMTVVELAQLSGIGRESVQQYCTGKVANPRGSRPEKLGKVLGVTERYLRFGEKRELFDQLSPNARMADPAVISLPQRQSMPQDVPVLGNGTGGGDGAMNIGGPIDYLRRPPALAKSRDDYAVYVSGTSMQPRFFSGEPIFVSPYRPVSVGDDVVVQCRTPGGDLLAFVKVVTGRTGSGWVFGQYNPAGPWEPPHPVETVHRVYKNADLYIP